jgi:uncharacterized protein (DUF952 family)
MPRLVPAPTTVVKTSNVCIDEFFGGASCNPCGDISFAHVKAKGGWAEEWQAPAFDEYTLILKGKITVEHSHGPPVVVSAGQAVFMPKGERVRWVFTEDAEYVPICLPAFSPDNCFREEGPSAPQPIHNKHTKIYHLVQKTLWEECKRTGKTYYPPTYEQDGFTHATADPSKLLTVANYFYEDVVAEWLCLEMSRDSIFDAGITLKFEDPSPVGSKKALTSKESGGERFPHMYGGIPPKGVVIKEYVVQRSAGARGKYLAIDGLCAAEGESGGAGAILAAAVRDTAGKLVKLLKSGGLVGGLACGALVGFALGKAR